MVNKTEDVKRKEKTKKKKAAGLTEIRKEARKATQREKEKAIKAVYGGAVKPGNKGTPPKHPKQDADGFKKNHPSKSSVSAADRKAPEKEYQHHNAPSGDSMQLGTGGKIADKQALADLGNRKKKVKVHPDKPSPAQQKVAVANPVIPIYGMRAKPAPESKPAPPPPLIPVTESKANFAPTASVEPVHAKPSGKRPKNHTGNGLSKVISDKERKSQSADRKERLEGKQHKLNGGARKEHKMEQKKAKAPLPETGGSHKTRPDEKTMQAGYNEKGLHLPLSNIPYPLGYTMFGMGTLGAVATKVADSGFATLLADAVAIAGIYSVTARALGEANTGPKVTHAAFMAASSVPLLASGYFLGYFNGLVLGAISAGASIVIVGKIYYDAAKGAIDCATHPVDCASSAITSVVPKKYQGAADTGLKSVGLSILNPVYGLAYLGYKAGSGIYHKIKGPDDKKADRKENTVLKGKHKKAKM